MPAATPNASANSARRSRATSPRDDALRLAQWIASGAFDASGSPGSPGAGASREAALCWLLADPHGAAPALARKFLSRARWPAARWSAARESLSQAASDVEAAVLDPELAHWVAQAARQALPCAEPAPPVFWRLTLDAKGGEAELWALGTLDAQAFARSVDLAPLPPFLSHWGETERREAFAQGAAEAVEAALGDKRVAVHLAEPGVQSATRFAAAASSRAGGRPPAIEIQATRDGALAWGEADLALAEAALLAFFGCACGPGASVAGLRFGRAAGDAHAWRLSEELRARLLAVHESSRLADELARSEGALREALAKRASEGPQPKPRARAGAARL
jgi:hypothetical protein